MIIENAVLSTLVLLQTRSLGSVAGSHSSLGDQGGMTLTALELFQHQNRASEMLSYVGLVGRRHGTNTARLTITSATRNLATLAVSKIAIFIFIISVLYIFQ